ncbi:uncharacterized, partial [Lates japonicus]
MEKGGGGQRRRRVGGEEKRVLAEGHSLIVTKKRTGGDPVATREFSAQQSDCRLDIISVCGCPQTSVSQKHHRCPSRQEREECEPFGHSAAS